jgi:lysine-ketoglutarate reductase/saccharopine dehydrogenase-like protein (TIGR00300 family)
MEASETVQLSGHVIDTGQLARVLDVILERGADYELADLAVGRRHQDATVATIIVRHEDREKLHDTLRALVELGVEPVEQTDAKIVVADIDACFPEGFTPTTNMPTQVRIDGQWEDVDRPEMDLGIQITDAGPHTIPMLSVKAGDQIVTGYAGVRVRPERTSTQSPTAGEGFGFMSSDVSSEKPQGLLVDMVAQGMRDARARGERILWVAGPGLVHTGSVPGTVALIRAGWLNALFAGNALPTHDIENALYGTSLGISQTEGVPTEHGHSHHIRAINTIRRHGSIKGAVEAGVLTHGVSHACVVHDVAWVLASSVRDDGPLPDVELDMQVAQQQMREVIWGDDGGAPVGFCLIVATMLHGIATGNLLPSHVPLVCVDINPATVTKLADRGSAQAVGIVTDVGLFVKELASRLAPDELAEELARAAKG